MLHQASPNFCQAQDPEDLQDHQMQFNINKFWKLLVRIMPREKNVLKFLFPLEKIENIYLYHKGMLNLMLWLWWWCKLSTVWQSQYHSLQSAVFCSEHCLSSTAIWRTVTIIHCIVGCIKWGVYKFISHRKIMQVFREVYIRLIPLVTPLSWLPRGRFTL